MSRERGNYRQVYLKHNKGVFGSGIYICGYCFKPVTKSRMEVDHIMPFSKGGTNHISNLTSSCRKCNRSKSNKIDTRVIRGFGTKLVGGTIGLAIAIPLALTVVPFKKLVLNKKTNLLTKIIGVALTAGIVIALYSVASTFVGGLLIP